MWDFHNLSSKALLLTDRLDVATDCHFKVNVGLV
mgnify:CR=1 FL=1